MRILTFKDSCIPENIIGFVYIEYRPRLEDGNVPAYFKVFVIMSNQTAKRYRDAAQS